MLEEIINNPDLQKFIATFETGQSIFLEGDDSQDLYILVSGHLDILKGNKKITHITEQGALFGEMSFLLGTQRTGTAKAMDDLKVIRIPKENITDFLHEFPNVASSITKILAQRLDETSQILYGLEEFCDQLPDAVILTDRKGRILMWNAAAEKLYGRDWHEMRHRLITEIYEEPEVYRHFLEEVESMYSVREKILKVMHPEKGTQYISTSTTLLYDGQHNCQGVLSLGRDVTSIKNMEKRYRRARYWLIPIFILLALLGAALFFGYPYFSKGYHTMGVKKQELRNQLGKDYLLLKSLLAKPFLEGQREATAKLMKDFFNIQVSTNQPYTGLILLDDEKRVVNASSAKGDTDTVVTTGSSYAGIDFQGSDSSLHRVLIVYRTDKEHPMGYKGLEIAFEMTEADRFLGWLVFQLDGALLEKEYQINEESLRNFEFKKP